VESAAGLPAADVSEVRAASPQAFLASDEFYDRDMR
jgi:hypothetical protein